MTIIFFLNILEMKIEFSGVVPFQKKYLKIYLYERYQLDFLQKFSLFKIQIFQIENRT